MSTMVIEFYEALLEAGASKEKATKAAEVAARFVRTDERNTLATKEDIFVLKEDAQNLKEEVHIIQAELKMVKWIVSGVGFGIVILVLETFLR